MVPASDGRPGDRAPVSGPAREPAGPEPARREPGGRVGGGWSVGIDVGGTFTDAVALDETGRTVVAKVPSTPDDPAGGLLDALAALRAGGVEPARVGRLVHGTTVATNALLTGRSARVVLCVTAGFRDLLAIRDGMRPEMYDLFQPRPRELVARADRIEVRERIGADGRTTVALDEAEIERVVAAVRRRRPASVAVAFLFSFLDPGHEERLGAALEAALPGIPVTLSSRIAREFREYPRTATTVIAAGLRPVLERYLERAASGAAGYGIGTPLLVMESSGGLVGAAQAGREPHRLVLSGPAGGVGGAIELAGRLGLRDILTLDMGGTSVDVCLVRDGRPATTALRRHEGAPLVVPAIDIVTAGAGGGSIARLDPAGALRVGPESAGSDPGPAAYGRGGREATVTDAHVVVGTLDPAVPLAGRLRLDAAAARDAIGRLAGPLGLPVTVAAEGILALATAHLAGAIRRASLERGVDPRGLALVAFGGAGPLHAARLLRDLDLAEVVVPPAPGLLSAAGLVTGDLRLDAAQTVVARLDTVRPADLLAWWRREARRLSARLAREGIGPERRQVLAAADCRYVGQGYELEVPLGALTAAAVRALAAGFHAAHERAYGHRVPDGIVEAVTLRLRVIGRLDRHPPARLAPGRRDGRPDRAALRTERPVVLPGHREAVPVRAWRREALRAGDRLAGPAIVEQLDSTTLVLPGQVARVGEWGELRIREGRR